MRKIWTYVGNIDLSAGSTATRRATEPRPSSTAVAGVEVTAAVGRTARTAVSAAVAARRSNKSRLGLAVLDVF